MNYGFFDDAACEYVITNPRTPVKWINYVGTLQFGGFVDQTGGSLICRRDPALNRIVRYIAQSPAGDFHGETLYVRLHEKDGYQVFSAYFTPTLDPYEAYECRVGLGYTRITSRFYGIQVDTLIFVPQGENRLIRDIRVTNLRKTSVALDVIPVVEYTHPDALKQLTNADWIPQTMTSKAIPEEGGLVTLIQYPFMRRDMTVNFFTSNAAVGSYDTDRRVFLGENEYGTWARPQGLLVPTLANSQALRGDNIAAMLHPAGTLRPGATYRVITQLGQEDHPLPDQAKITFYRKPENVDAAFQKLVTFWRKFLDGLQVNTPDPDMNRMLNIHNPRQCYITRQWSRYLSMYQLGYGARGIGYRDSAQDVLGIVGLAPESAREMIRMLLQMQRTDGFAFHQFNPLSMEPSLGDAKDHAERPQYYSDDHLWIILAVAAYLKETGDRKFLLEEIPFQPSEPRSGRKETGTVQEHLRRALAFTRWDVGVHGLPLAGFADWNDTVNLPKGAESFFTAHLYGKALLEMIALCEWLGDPASAAAYRQDWEAMRKIVNDVGWDGEWYTRYFDHTGHPLGSHKNIKGQIYLNGQSWAVISGFATPERARQAMDAVYRLLNTSNGLKLSTPGFDGFDPMAGGITTYPPGAKENGGIFLHANPWAMIAETSLGNSDRAYQYYQQINPAARNDRIEVFECEPYVYPQNMLGDEHPMFGLARNSWLSGTAAWTYVAATQHILGIRPGYAGLEIDPHLPSGWPGFTARRLFRGVTYEITVRREGDGSQVSLRINGKSVPGKIVPVPAQGVKTLKVEVLIQ